MICCQRMRGNVFQMLHIDIMIVGDVVTIVVITDVVVVAHIAGSG